MAIVGAHTDSSKCTHFANGQLMQSLHHYCHLYRETAWSHEKYTNLIHTWCQFQINTFNTDWNETKWCRCSGSSANKDFCITLSPDSHAIRANWSEGINMRNRALWSGTSERSNQAMEWSCKWKQEVLQQSGSGWWTTPGMEHLNKGADAVGHIYIFMNTYRLCNDMCDSSLNSDGAE